MNQSNRTSILLRYVAISLAILIFAGFIVVKMFHTTVVHAEKWNQKAAETLKGSEVIVPRRGNILADDKSILATDLRYYTVRIDYRCERFREKTFRDTLPYLCDSLAKYYPFRTSAEWQAYLSRPLSKPVNERPRALKVVSNITSSEYERLRTFPFFSIQGRNKNGLFKETVLRRSNPYGQMAKRSIGGVGEQQNGEKHGISGLEMAFDSLLYGKPGVAKQIAFTRKISTWVEQPAVSGYDILTTIDVKMQDIVENELSRVLDTADADWGVAILMEVATGDIKAISNLEKSPVSGNYIEGMNRAVLGFEPGSVMKPISMLLALEDGLVNNIEESISIGSSYTYGGGRPITDSHYNASLTVKGVIEQSSNIGMTKIITNPAGQYHNNTARFRERLEEIGFLDPLNMGIAGERIPNIMAKPSRISLSRMCYGYATEIPPIYTLALYNAIANGGRFVRPRLVKELIGEDFDSVIPVSYIRDRICSKKNADKLIEMLTAVVWGDRGTARHYVKDKNVKIAGKTGTCYMIDEHGYNKSKKRLSFCGFFPAENPKYTCIVLTCNPRRNLMSAGSSSGQVVRSIASKMFSRGMLDNISDYKEGLAKESVPVLYASNKNKNHKKIKKELNLSTVKELSPEQGYETPRGTVPMVVGLGMREAIVALEESGYNVSFSGTGFVRAQTPKAGNHLAPGSYVNLSLTEF